MSFTLAILGRPNVGKSTLYNRLTGTRHALVHDTPGVTRDWREGDAGLGPLRFRILDTAGWENAKSGTLQARMLEQTRAAAARADALLLVVDGREGLTAMDRDILREIRKTGKPVALAVNKAESKLAGGMLEDALSLGLGEPAMISAEHNEGMAELYEVVEQMIRGSDDPREGDIGSSDHPVIGSSPIQIAFIGQPNAGKSTLLNRILKEERVLVSPEAGTTRDAIAADFEWKGEKLKLVDTAGMRKKAKVGETLEKMAVGDTLRVIRFAQVVVVLMDAASPLERQDLSIVSLVEREGRALVVALNKWDEVKEKEIYLTAFHREMLRLLPQVKQVQIVPISALKGTGVNQLLDAALKAYASWNVKIPTAALNRWLEDALATHQPPLVKGRRMKFRYLTQAKTRPPTFQIFGNISASDAPESYLRYLVNSLREAFDLPGVPIRLILRKPKNPYAEK
jgi:GTP-binding protein